VCVCVCVCVSGGGGEIETFVCVSLWCEHLGHLDGEGRDDVCIYKCLSVMLGYGGDLCGV
jgi:hypothetical protein